MDPNDPTQSATRPAQGPVGDWPPPPPPGPAGPGGIPTTTTPARANPPTASYPMVPPAAPLYFSNPEHPGDSGGAEDANRSPSGLLVAGAALALLLAGVVGFVLGVQVEKGRRPTSTVAAAPPVKVTTTPAAGDRVAIRARGVGGRVGGVTGGTFTVTLAGGTTTKVVVSPNTRFQKTTPGSLQDLAPGTVVLVQGPRGPDGSITANMVTIVPPGTRSGGAGIRQGGRGATTTTIAPG